MNSRRPVPPNAAATVKRSGLQRRRAMVLGLCLLLLVESALAQTLRLPPRRPGALDGKTFAQKISALTLTEREQAIADAILTGDVPEFLRKLYPVTVTNTVGNQTNVATFFATPDYLAIGSDEDFLLMPLSPNTAQRIADRLSCVLPTRKMVDAIYAAADVKFTPRPISPSAAMTTVSAFLQHSAMVRTQRLASNYPLGALVAGHQKDVVISARLASATNRVAIYGWQQTNGVPIQPLYLGHAASWVDYSHGIRLVQSEMLVNGEIKTVAEVLADPKLCGLISDEGVLTNGRYPTAVIDPISIAQPWPEQFTTSPHFGEMNRWLILPDGIRILINTPPPEAFPSDRTVQLVFFALPNGNTIEQTVGSTLQPGDDWHVDLQHIGAQTRWLRGTLSNRTLVVAYLEAPGKSWPAWRKSHLDQAIPRLFDDVRRIFIGRKLEVVLASHSGGGSLMFGYLNTLATIPDDVARLAFLDSNYAYDSRLHAEKIRRWLADSEAHHLCVLAYHDSVALLNGQTFVSEVGGTWGRSHALLADLGTSFTFTSRTNDGLETYSALNGRMQLLLKENPERKIFHTVQVERNGFIHALLSGTAADGQGYEYFGPRAYTNWIAAELLKLETKP